MIELTCLSPEKSISTDHAIGRDWVGGMARNYPGPTPGAPPPQPGQNSCVSHSQHRIDLVDSQGLWVDLEFRPIRFYHVFPSSWLATSPVHPHYCFEISPCHVGLNRCIHFDCFKLMKSQCLSIQSHTCCPISPYCSWWNSHIIPCIPIL